MKLSITTPQGRPYSLEPKQDVISIGRSATCDVVIPHGSISRQHARMFQKGDQWYLEDLGSTYGTFLGNKRISEVEVLSVGDVIQLAPEKASYTITMVEAFPKLVELVELAELAEQSLIRPAITLLEEIRTVPLFSQTNDAWRHHAARLIHLSQATEAVAGARDVTELAELFLEQVFQLFRPDVATFYLREPDGSYSLVAGRPQNATPPLSQTLAHQITDSNLALLVRDVTSDNRFHEAASVCEANLTAILASPLFEGDVIWGLVAAYSVNDTSCFTEEDMKLLVGLSSAATLRLRIIMLNEDAAKQLRENNRDLEEKVIQRTRELEHQNQRIRSSINYARRIQEAMLPGKKQLEALFPQSFVLNIPRDIVSGDFYWCGTAGDTAILAQVDCTGHGVPGAFMSMMGHTLLNQIIFSEGLTNPAAILNQLNREVQVALNQAGNTMHAADGMELGICCLCTSSGKVSFAGACFNLYVVHPEKDLCTLKGNRQSIGGKQRRAHKGFTNNELEPQPGEHFFLFTDGFADQPNQENKRFGTKRLKDLLQRLVTERLSMPAISERLQSELVKYTGSMPQRDDIGAIAFLPIPEPASGDFFSR